MWVRLCLLSLCADANVFTQISHRYATVEVLDDEEEEDEAEDYDEEGDCLR